MGAKSLAKLAADRDTVTPGQSVVEDSTDVLVAVVVANIGTGYGPFRWSAYVAFIALAVPAPFILFKHRTAAISKDVRKFPIPGCLTADVAAAAWRLAPWRKGILSAPL